MPVPIGCSHRCSAATATLQPPLTASGSIPSLRQDGYDNSDISVHEAEAPVPTAGPQTLASPNGSSSQ